MFMSGNLVFGGNCISCCKPMFNYDKSYQLLRINKQLCSFSADSRFLALANQSNLIIKNTGTFDDYLTFVFDDIIEGMEWSPDSEYIVCYSFKKAVVQIFSISYPDWKFKLTEGSSGLENVMWTPDSRHIITLADLNVQLSIWSLIDHSVMYIQCLKSSATKGIEFSPNGKYLALIVTETGQDNVDIYKTRDWKLSRKLICEGLSSIDGLCWSPNNEAMGIWCSIDGQAKLIVYSTLTESYEGVFCSEDNKLTDQIALGNQFEEKLRGLEIVKWMPSGQLLAVSGHNEVVVLLNSLTWKPILQLRLEPTIKENNYLMRVFKECIIKDVKDINRPPDKTSASNEKHILEEVGNRPVNIPIVKTDILIGADLSAITVNIIDTMEFSSCGQYLALRHRVYPSTLWVWDIQTNGIDIFILQNTISTVKWNPIHPQLLIFTESFFIFEWNPRGVLCYRTPRGMTTLDARWHPSGDVVVLCGYNRAVIYPIHNDR
ncbi:WD repeat-containing protein WRAP73-like [Phymastichus coffea]|uniref:WD repeat-containing protein WRAP73-like n=1 Tax=Phymastichus coffea TaxID=108790 RepID=UPI00273C0AAC|nr:WD repeat-containing protein WRAP73-like [Phymastichus coffea]